MCRGSRSPNGPATRWCRSAACGAASPNTASWGSTTVPEAEDKIYDVVGLYRNPPTHAVVLSLDEKTQIQALSRTQPLLPLRPGLPARQTHDYRRHGRTSLYAALEIASGRVIGECA